MAGDGWHRNWHNVDVALFNGVGRYNIPKLAPFHLESTDFDLIGYQYAPMIRNHAGIGIHFYHDDYKFERVWNSPEKYVPMLKKFDFVCTPNFSMYRDYPFPIQLYNHYRSCRCGAYWQLLGMNVIPSVCWSDKSSFSWCFEALPYGSTVAVSSIGAIRDKDARVLFIDGYNEMTDRLNPDKVIFLGSVPDEISSDRIIHFDHRTKHRLHFDG